MAESPSIASVLRTRICLMQGSAEDTILHEGMIATEFGVSRTPIRQVLQKLAYERLVETRSGVGTIVSPLYPEHRARDLLVLKALFRSAADCAGEAGPEDSLADALADRLETAAQATEWTGSDAQGYLDMRSELLEIASDAAPDAILGDAMRAAHWRHIRWRMADHAWKDEGAAARLTALFRRAAASARSDGLAGFYGCLSDAEL